MNPKLLPLLLLLTLNASAQKSWDSIGFKQPPPIRILIYTIDTCLDKPYWHHCIVWKQGGNYAYDSLMTQLLPYCYKFMESNLVPVMVPGPVIRDTVYVRSTLGLAVKDNDIDTAPQYAVKSYWSGISNIPIPPIVIKLTWPKGTTNNSILFNFNGKDVAYSDSVGFLTVTDSLGLISLLLYQSKGIKLIFPEPDKYEAVGVLYTGDSIYIRKNNH